MTTNNQIEIIPVILAGAVSDNGHVILTYKITYPRLSSADPDQHFTIINDFYENQALNYLQYVLTTLKTSAVHDYQYSTANDYQIHTYEVVVNYTVTDQLPNLLSLYMDQYEYTAGAHGNTTRTSQTWDLGSQKQFKLADFFPDTVDFQAYIIAAVTDDIARQTSTEGAVYDPNYKQTAAETFSPDNFYLSPEALVIYFQQYSIAPYFRGIPEFHLPYSSQSETVSALTL